MTAKLTLDQLKIITINQAVALASNYEWHDVSKSLFTEKQAIAYEIYKKEVNEKFRQDYIAAGIARDRGYAHAFINARDLKDSDE